MCATTLEGAWPTIPWSNYSVGYSAPNYESIGSGYALAGNSNAYFATWAQVVGTFNKTFATRFDVATGKRDELPTIVSDDAGDNRAIGIDAHGNAILAFDQEGPTKSLMMAARYVASTGEWGRPDALTLDANDFGFPTLTVAPNGTASLFYGPTYRDGPLRGPAPRGSYRLFR